MRLTIPLFAVFASLPFAPAAFAQSDDFNDNAVGPQWSLVVDDPANLNIAETGGKAVITATTGGQSNNDALYLSNGPSGFKLSTATDFSMSIDYNFASRGGTAGLSPALALVFGVGRDLDGTDSAAVGYGYATVLPNVTVAAGVFAFRSDDVQSPPQANLAFPSSGTLTVSYDAAADVLTATGGNALPFTLASTVRGVWGADSLYVSFGARGSGVATPAGGATLDNFVINSGTVIPVPEPAAAGVLCLGLLALRRRR